MSTIDKRQVVDDNVKIPVGLTKVGSELFVVSLLLPRMYFRDPFFIDTLAKSFEIIKSKIKLPEEDELLARPVHYNPSDKRVVYTPLDEFIDKYVNKKSNINIGFIFHMSRCGSTLASQMLATSDRFFVLSEPTIINAVLDPALDITPEKRKLLLKSCIKSLIECSPLMCEWMFIKFRSWNILYSDIILKDFPESGWIFIHRHGLEVLSSVLEKPPGWLRSRKRYAKYFTEYLAVDGDISRMTDDEYATRMLSAFCRIAKEAVSKNSIFIDYSDLKNNFILAVKALWHMDLDEKEVKTMSSMSRLYSKDVNKQEEFLPDSEKKRAKATMIQVEFANKFVESERLKLHNIEHE